MNNIEFLLDQSPDTQCVSILKLELAPYRVNLRSLFQNVTYIKTISIRIVKKILYIKKV